MSCPYCGEVVAGEAERCESCGEHLSERPVVAASPSVAKIVVGIVLGAVALGALLFVLAGAFVFSRVKANRGLAFTMRTEADMKMLSDSLKLYRLNMGAYPGQLSDLWQEPAESGGKWRGPYLASPPVDPWGNPYVYSNDGGGFTLTCYGEDGAPGGVDLAADVSISR